MVLPVRSWVMRAPEVGVGRGCPTRSGDVLSPCAGPSVTPPGALLARTDEGADRDHRSPGRDDGGQRTAGAGALADRGPHRRPAGAADGRSRDPGLADRHRPGRRARRPAGDDLGLLARQRRVRGLAPGRRRGGARARGVVRRPAVPGQRPRGLCAAAGHGEGRRRRPLRPVPPRAPRAGPRARARQPAGSSSRTPSRRPTGSACAATSSSARARSSATSGSATSPRSGRLNPVTYDQDSTLRALIDVVPFGIAPEPPQSAAPVLKGVRRRHRPRPTRSCSGAAASTTGSTRSRSCERSTSCGAGTTTCGCSSSGCSTPTPTCPRCGCREPLARSRASSGSPAPTCCSTRHGCATTSGGRTCSRPTSA